MQRTLLLSFHLLESEAIRVSGFRFFLDQYNPGYAVRRVGHQPNPLGAMGEAAVSESPVRGASLSERPSGPRQ